MKITEIAPDVYRLSLFVPEADLQFNQFLVKDDEPLLFHTGMRGIFPLVREAIEKIIEPRQLRHIGFSKKLKFMKTMFLILIVLIFCMNTVNGQTNQPKTLLEIGGIESKPGRLSESIERRCRIPAIHSRKIACSSEGSRKKNVGDKKRG
jgi:hypothetical protein